MAESQGNQGIDVGHGRFARIAFGFTTGIFAAGVVLFGSLLYSGYILGFSESIQAYDAAIRYTGQGLYALFTVALGITLIAYVRTELWSAGSRSGGTGW